MKKVKIAALAAVAALMCFTALAFGACGENKEGGGSGTTLAAVTNVKAENGKITFNGVAGAEDYRVFFYEAGDLDGTDKADEYATMSRVPGSGEGEKSVNIPYDYLDAGYYVAEVVARGADKTESSASVTFLYTVKLDKVTITAAAGAAEPADENSKVTTVKFTLAAAMTAGAQIEVSAYEYTDEVKGELLWTEKMDVTTVSNFGQTTTSATSTNTLTCDGATQYLFEVKGSGDGTIIIGSDETTTWTGAVSEFRGGGWFPGGPGGGPPPM